jgi:DNA-binding NarL/FixJ family response regulator
MPASPNPDWTAAAVHTITRLLDTAARSVAMLVVRDWDEQSPWLEQANDTDNGVERCPPELGSLRRKLAAHRPRWLVIGAGIDESVVQALVATASATCPDLALAMLGPVDDLRRCERWLRCGCRVYLPESVPFAAVRQALDFAAAADAVVVDRVFYQEGARTGLAGPVPSLTHRQREVLRLLDSHLTNREIAATLHLSENTIEFHVRRLLDKLRARSRMQAVRHASDLGLI